MTEQRELWVVLNHCHPNSGKASIVWETQSWRKRDAIAKFIKDSGSPWKYWRTKFNFRCERVTVTIQTK